MPARPCDLVLGRAQEPEGSIALELCIHISGESETMSVSVRRGTIREIGPGIAEHGDFSRTSTFEYVEFEDGTVLRHLFVRGGLSGKLTTALESAQVVEIHCTSFVHKKTLPVAVKLGDGGAYTSEFNAHPIFAQLLLIFLVLAGILTLPLFGIGLLLLVVAWMLGRSRRINVKGGGTWPSSWALSCCRAATVGTVFWTIQRGCSETRRTVPGAGH